jgi:hypothetical protein
VTNANGNQECIMASVDSGIHIWDPKSLEELAKRLPLHDCVSKEGGSPIPAPVSAQNLELCLGHFRLNATSLPIQTSTATGTTSVPKMITKK